MPFVQLFPLEVPVKFVMTSLGVGFFSSMIRHDQFRVYDSQGEESQPIAAGSVHLKRVEVACEVIALDGNSINLGLDASRVYPDWVSRYQKTGLPAQQTEYPKFRAKVLFFPFEQIGRFEARGAGACAESFPTSLEELVVHIKKA